MDHPFIAKARVLNEESAARILQNLREEVKHLASDPPVVEAYLRELGTWDCLDELALEFERSYSTLSSEGRLSEAQGLALGLLNTELERISGHKDAVLWYGTRLFIDPSGVRSEDSQAKLFDALTPGRHCSI
jgi:hypothetical protein